MCIILLDTRDSTDRIPKKVMKRALDKNPDGMGIMWGNGESVSTWTTMDDFNGIWSRYCAARNKSLTVAVHFRITTKGDTSLENAHPFLTSHGLGVMHNGTITNLSSLMAKEDTRSDSHFMVDEVLSHLPGNFCTKPGLAHLVTKYLSGDRMLVMDHLSRYSILGADGYWMKQSEYGNTDTDWTGVWLSHDRITKYLMTGEEPAKWGGYKGNAGYTGYQSYWDGDTYEHRYPDKQVKDRKAKTTLLVFDPGRQLEQHGSFICYYGGDDGDPFFIEGVKMLAYEDYTFGSGPVLLPTTTEGDDDDRVYGPIAVLTAEDRQSMWSEADLILDPFMGSKVAFGSHKMQARKVKNNAATLTVEVWGLDVTTVPPDVMLYPVPFGDWDLVKEEHPITDEGELDPSVIESSESMALTVVTESVAEEPDDMERGIKCHVCKSEDTYTYACKGRRDGVLRAMYCNTCSEEHAIIQVTTPEQWNNA